MDTSEIKDSSTNIRNQEEYPDDPIAKYVVSRSSGLASASSPLLLSAVMLIVPRELRQTSLEVTPESFTSRCCDLIVKMGDEDLCRPRFNLFMPLPYFDAPKLGTVSQWPKKE